MNKHIHIVKRGDSLTKISKSYGTHPQEIAKINNITNLDVIHVGQKLLLPNTPSSKLLKAPSDEIIKDDKENSTKSASILLEFLDALDKPIENIKVIIKNGSQTFSFLTNKSGQLPIINQLLAYTAVNVEIEKLAGGTKKYPNSKPRRACSM